MALQYPEGFRWELKVLIKICTDFFSHWKFSHPYPEDFKMIMDSGREKICNPYLIN